MEPNGYVWTSWKRAIRLLDERRLEFERLVTHQYPLDQFEAAFRATQYGGEVAQMSDFHAD